MPRPPAPLFVLLLATLPAAAPASAAVLWTQVTRNVGSEAILTNATQFAIDTDSESSDTSGAFVASASADTTVAGVSGSSASEQDSDLSAGGLTGTGSFVTATEVTVPDGFADVFGRSNFTGYFDLDTPTPFSLTGTLVNGGNGTSAHVFLIGPGGSVVDVYAFAGETVPVDASGTLAPGSYVVGVNVAGNAQEMPPDLLTEASGSWEMAFLLGGETAAPVTAPARGMRVYPNPTQGITTIALASRRDVPATIRIFDAGGRTVRTFEASSGVATWDARDVGGRPVPAGVYFVTATRGGLVESRRVTVLR